QADVHPQMLRNLRRRPLFTHVAIEILKLFWIVLLFYTRDCRGEQIFLPLLFPKRLQIDNVWIGHAFDRRRLAIIGSADAPCVSRFALSKLIRDPPARDLEKPAFE